MELYVYYVNDENLDLDAYDLEQMVLSAFYDSYYVTGASFGYVDDICEDYGEDVSVGMVKLSKFADVLAVRDFIRDEFLAEGVELVDIQVGAQL